jgi:ankyrin repeat protein/gamma-glutamyl-gamma-aminobutyrate hydrolase PuuD
MESWKAFLEKSNFKEEISLLSQAELNVLDNEGLSLLYCYCLKKIDIDYLEYLLKDLKLDPNNNSDEYPIWKSVIMYNYLNNENSAIVELLHKYGADFNRLDKDGRSALTLSIDNGNNKAFDIILPYVDLNKPAISIWMNWDKKNLPISAAISKKDIEAVKKLIEAGANISTIDNDNLTPMNYAVEKDQVEIIKLLLEAGYDINIPNKNGVTHFMEAIYFGAINSVKLLLNSAIDQNIVVKNNNLNITIAHFIMLYSIKSHLFEDISPEFESTNKVTIIKDLMSLFPNYINNNNKQTIIDDIKKNVLFFMGLIITVDLGNVSSENILNEPMFKDAIDNVNKVIDIIIDYQANIMPQAFNNVINNDHIELNNLLNDNPKLAGQFYKNQTLLGMSLLFGSKNCTYILLENENIDINIKDINGDNILSSIVAMKDLSRVESLLEKGVDIDAINNKFSTAADKILFHFHLTEYNKTKSIITKYSKDSMHKLMILKDEYREFNFDPQKTYIAIAHAGGFWSIDHFSMARKIMEHDKNVQVLIIDKDNKDKDFLKHFSGFIMPGGGDSFPKNQEFVIEDIKNMGENEKFYTEILSIAKEFSIPTIGICLGNQYIGLNTGATLNSTIGHNGGGHKGMFLKGTLPYFMSLSKSEQGQILESKYYPDIIFSIDTAHNFAVVPNKPGDLVIGAYSSAGVVESISYNNHLIGFQFHPENKYSHKDPSNEAVRSTNLIDNFVNLAKQHYEWHSFAEKNNFTYQQAQRAIEKQNKILLDQVFYDAKEGLCLISDEKYQQCNVTKSEFSWPEPKIEMFLIGESDIV